MLLTAIGHGWLSVFFTFNVVIAVLQVYVSDNWKTGLLTTIVGIGPIISAWFSYLLAAAVRRVQNNNDRVSNYLRWQ